jgi:ComF family protein
MMGKKYFSLLLDFLNAVFDLIYPPVCLHCNNRIQRQQDYLCTNCEGNLQSLDEPQCPLCGYPLQDHTCYFCQENELAYNRAASLYEYEGPTRTLIHYMKFGDMPGIADYLAEKADSFLSKTKLFSDTDIITAIPLHSVRKRQRGYNQAALLAAHLAKKRKWNLRMDLVKRIRATVPQANLIKKKRLVNVDNAFEIKKMIDLKQENILLLDDVFTTGATVQAVCRELKKAHPGKIYVLTIGRA